MGMKKMLTAVQVVLGGALAACLIRLLYATIRWHRVSDEQVTQHRVGTPIIFVFWHSRLVMASGLYSYFRVKRSSPPFMLISSHGDGRLIAFAVRLLGIRSIAGSSTRGGLKALLELIRESERGSDVGFTPDGPKGPPCECKEGIVLVAQKTGRAVYPMSYSVDRKWQLGSWDGMIIPKPFSRGIVITGSPIFVASDEDREVARLRIQDALNEIHKRAEQHWSDV